jgi:hypothetical protein
MMRHPLDNRIHFSELKQHAKSAAHVKLAVQGAREITRAMIVGGVADSIVFQHGRSHVVAPCKRDDRVAEWRVFKVEHAGKYICTQAELDDAEGAAQAVLADPAAQRALKGCDFQQVMTWDAFGLPCAAGIKGERGGFDALGPDSIADLKVTACTEPEALSRHLLNQLWHAQLAWYRIGARTLGRRVDVCRIIAVESAAPYNVTVLRIPERWLVQGEQIVTTWAERHRACEAADAWPGYAQEEIDAIEPAWMAEHVELEGLDGGQEEG